MDSSKHQSNNQVSETLLPHLTVPNDDFFEVDGAIIFCRVDSRITTLAAMLLDRMPGESYILLSGGLGKDSGFLMEKGIPEAEYHADNLRKLDYPSKRIIVESASTNGNENSLYSSKIIQQQSLPHKKLILAGHPISLRRLTANHFTNVANSTLAETEYYFQNTDYDICVENPGDRKEIVDEIIRLATWPDQFSWEVRPAPIPEASFELARQLASERN